MNKYFILTTRGFEDVAKDEIEIKLQNVSVEEVSYRKVIFSYTGNPSDLLNLRSVEDAYLMVGKITNVGHTQDSLGELISEISGLDFKNALKVVSDIREKNIKEFSISSSSVGKRNFSYVEVKELLSSELAKILGMSYEDEKHQDFDIRVFIEHTEAVIGVRLSDRPLHRRAYKQETTKGSLISNIAYIMASLADIQPNEVVLDPMCGSGTIAIEASYFMPEKIISGDIDKEAVRITKENVKRANISLPIETEEWDARKLPLEDKSVNKIICNLPFGKQVEITEETVEGFYSSLMKEFTRVIKSNGKIVLLTSNNDELVRTLQKHKELHIKENRETNINGEVSNIAVIEVNNL